MHSFHIILVPTVAIMPLIMLLPKPFILRARAYSGVLEHDPADPHASEEFDFGEVFIHQGISFWPLFNLSVLVTLPQPLLLCLGALQLTQLWCCTVLVLRQ